MPHNPILSLFVLVSVTVRERVDELRRNPDRGSHAVEYAIGIGLGAAVIIVLYAKYKAAVNDIVNKWVLQ
jgi:hypothetical protein